MLTSQWRISRGWVVIFVVFVVCEGVVAFSQTQSPAAQALDQGIKEFKAAQYSDATRDLKKALELDPDYTMAELYLGATYAIQVVPNLKTPENLALAEDAVETLKRIPQGDGNYHNALKQIAMVYRNVGRLDEARSAEIAALDIFPDDPKTHYTIGVIDWTQAYQFSVDALATDGLKDDGLGNAHMSSATCEKIKAHNEQLVGDAITHLTRAIELDLNYSDAMLYLNLVYRRRADFECADPTARAQDVASAEKWSKQAAQVTEAPSAGTASQ